MARTQRVIEAGIAGRVRSEFARVLRESLLVGELAKSGLFGADDERIIQQALDRLFYVVKLPVGGAKELAVANRLEKLAETLRKMRRSNPTEAAPGSESEPSGTENEEEAGLNPLAMAKRWREVEGGYYVLAPLKKDRLRAFWRGEMQKAIQAGQREVVWWARLVLNGTPKRISDFYLEWKFILQKQNFERLRMVRLVNLHGESSRLLGMDGEAFSGPKDFRTFLNRYASGSFQAGERELQALQEDSNHYLAFNVVNEIGWYGWDELTGAWVFADCAVVDGEIQIADEHGVFWTKRGAIKVGERSVDEQSFKQKPPMMHPDLELVKDKETGRYSLVEAKAVGGESESAAVGDLFREFTLKLSETLADYDAYMVVGAMLMYYAGPEIYGRYSGMGGLWLHGQMSSGKSSVMRWLMELFGIHVESGGGSRSSLTRAGLMIMASQNSSLPVWVDEYVETELHDQGISGVLRQGYNRESDVKWSKGEDRKIRTSFVVTGETSSNIASLRSRYVLCLVSANSRKQNHWDWFHANRRYFFTIGRHILMHRKEFAAAVMKKMERVHGIEALKGADVRTVDVYGAAASAFFAAVTLFGTHTAEEMEACQERMEQQCLAADFDTQSVVNVHQVWEMVVSAHGRGVFEGILDRVFKVKKKRRENAPGRENQLGWESVTLLVNPGMLVDVLSEDARRRWVKFPLNKSDLRDQMSKQPYWNGNNKLGHVAQFGKGAGVTRCWGIELDHHPMGYQAVTDETWLESQKEPRRCLNPGCGEEFLTEPNTLGPSCPHCGGARSEFPKAWAVVDPREGPLYSIVHGLEEAEKQERA